MAVLTAVVGIGQTKYQAKRLDLSMPGLVREAAEKALKRKADQLAKTDHDLQRMRKRVRNQDMLYTSIRSELDAKKDRLRTQQEELERLRALEVVLAPPPTQAADIATIHVRQTDIEQDDVEMALTYCFERRCAVACFRRIKVFMKPCKKNAHLERLNDIVIGA